MSSAQWDLLRGLGEAEASGVLALGATVGLPAGAPLFEIGGEADRLFQLVRGRVSLTLPMQLRGRREDVAVEEKRPGEILGWSALVPPHRFTLRAVAVIESELLAFPREALLRHFADNPIVGYTVGLNVAGVVGRRLQVFQAMWLREMQRVIELRQV